MRKQMAKGRQVESSQQVKEAKAAEFLQRRFRGILARRQVEEMREEEMVFLGMKARPKTAAEEGSSILKELAARGAEDHRGTRPPTHPPTHPPLVRFPLVARCQRRRPPTTRARPSRTTTTALDDDERSFIDDESSCLDDDNDSPRRQP